MECFYRGGLDRAPIGIFVIANCPNFLSEGRQERMATETSTSFSIETDGRVSVRERVEPEAGEKYYPSPKELVEADDGSIALTVSHNEDHDAFAKIELSGHHIENPETGIAYHARVGTLLARKDVTQLRGYLDFLLQFMPEDECET